MMTGHWCLLDRIEESIYWIIRDDGREVSAPVGMQIRAQQMAAVEGLPSCSALLAFGHCYHRPVHRAIPVDDWVV